MMKYCPTCKRVYVETNKRFCTVDGVRLSLKDPFRLVGSIVVDKYRLDALVGIGGFGAVYSAHHLGIDRNVAFKILLPHFSVSDKKVRHLFEQEAKLAGRLSHENIVDVKDAGRTADGIAYMVMEWLEGCTLEEEIAANEQLSFERTSEILRQVSAALDEAHTAHIVHRDLKPSNIMIVKHHSGKDRIKVLDFGIAKVISSTDGSAVSAVIGTPHYASPEQLKEGGNIDIRSDIYSLGVMLYQMLTGALPFHARSVAELIRLQLTASAPPVRRLRPDAPVIIEQLLESLLETKPEDRPGRASEISRRFDLGVKVKQLFGEGVSAFEERDYQLAVSKLEELLRLSPSEPAATDLINAALAAQEGRKEIERLLREASQACDSGEHRLAIQKWGEVLRLSPNEPGVRLKLRSSSEAQRAIDDKASKSRGDQHSGFDVDRQPAHDILIRRLRIACLAVVVIAFMIVAIWRSGITYKAPMATPTPASPSAEEHDISGRTLYNQNKYAEAEAEYTKAVALAPGNAEYHNNLGDALSIQEKYTDAEPEYRKAVALHQDHTVYHSNLGVVLYKQKKYAEAEAEYRKAVALDPGNAEYHYNLGDALWFQAKYAKAEPEYRKAVALDQENAQYHNSLGVALYRQKKYVEAESEDRKAVSHEPGNAEYHDDLGDALQMQGKYAEAEPEYRKAVALDQGNAVYHNGLGIALHAQEKYAEAESEFRKAVALNHNSADYHYNFGDALRMQKKYAEAERECKEAVALNQGNAAYHNALGCALYEQEKYAEAESEYRKAVTLNHNNATYHDNLGYALSAQKKYAGAEKEFKAALLLNPNNPGVIDRLKNVQENQKKDQ